LVVSSRPDASASACAAARHQETRIPKRSFGIGAHDRINFAADVRHDFNAGRFQRQHLRA
jgi:hypothetical protein